MTSTSTLSHLLTLPPISQLTRKVYSLGYTSGQSLRSIFQHPLSVTTPSSTSTSIYIAIYNYLTHLVPRYTTWWIHLIKNEPLHVILETLLTLFIVYLCIRRTNNRHWRKSLSEKLTTEEKEELLEEWKRDLRKPLAPVMTIDRTKIGSNIIVEKVKGSKLFIQDKNHPVLNFTSHDYLGVSCPLLTSTQTDGLKETSTKAMDIYAFGSCGPRGFYGSNDAHLDLESDFARYCGTDAAILYSDGSAAVSSAVAAFAKRGDLLVVDNGVSEPLVTGVRLSRANVKYFQHNDINDLRRVLERVRATDITLKRKSNDQRRFIVLEGLYPLYGHVCKLDQIMKLKIEFQYRLILEESHSLGTLGDTGKGVLQKYNYKCQRDAEIVVMSLENCLGSGGGIVVGNEEVVDHQRLSGAGYCFSASGPPFMSRATQWSLKDRLGNSEIGSTWVQKLKDNVGYFYEVLGEMLGDVFDSDTHVTPNTHNWRLVITSDIGLSPLVFLELREDPRWSASKTLHDSYKDDTETEILPWNLETQISILNDIAKLCLERNVAVISTGGHVVRHLVKIPNPALRLTVMAQQSREDMYMAVRVLREVIEILRG